MTDDCFMNYAARRLSYNESTGVFVWNRRPRSDFNLEYSWKTWNTRYSGKAAGCVSSDGYRYIVIDGRVHLAHRLAWLLSHGYWPQVIDHINGKKDDNRIENLRSVTQAENSRNSKNHSNNRSGTSGVYWNKERSMWQASITINSRKKFIGRFTDKGAAIAARKEAEKKYGYHKNHGRLA